MITRSENKKFTWVDVESPTPEEVAELCTEFKLDSYIRDELAEHIERSKIRFFKDHTYIVFQFPTYEGVLQGGKKKEVDFIIGENFLITIHYEKIHSINETATESLLTEDARSVKDLFFHAVYKEYRKVGKQLETLDALIQKTEQKIFGDPHNKTVEKISSINHTILDFKRALRFHEEIWLRIEEDEKLKQEGTRLHNEYKKIWGALMHYQEITHSLQGTNDSLLAFKTNEVMKLLTIFNFIILPISIIPTALGLATTTEAQIYVISGFIIVSLFIYSVFKTKKWL